MSSDTRPFRLAIVVPTRNRVRMAIRAVESVFACGVRSDRVGVVVSDNSTDPRESRLLEQFSADAGRKMSLVRPPSPLPMTAHWNFAIEYALGLEGYTHFMFLTDRMLVRAHRFRQVIDTIASFPEEVISFSYDRIDDVRRPVVYKPLPRSGDVYRIDSKALLEMSARMEFPSCLPRMLNSVAPRSHINAVQARFGAVFSSLSPDFNFCYRTLATRESILFFDRSVLLTYGLDRSNGNSFARGVMTRDSNDFIRDVALARDSFITPYPEFLTIGNAVIHEYLVAKHDTRSSGFGDIEIENYRRMLSTEVRKFEDGQHVADSLERLRLRGWSENCPDRLNRWKRVVVECALGVLKKRFDDVDEAIAYAMAHEGPAWRWLPHPTRKFGPKVLAL